MRLLVIQNDPHTPMSLAGSVMCERGATLDIVLPHDGGTMPQSADLHDGVVVLGGPQHAGDDERFPSFPAMLGLIRAFHDASKPVLGICLGSQLLARAFGGKVYRHHTFEWGFSPLRLTDHGEADALLRSIAPSPRIMQWHEDTFDLPPGAVPLIEGDLCRSQAFRLGRTSYGFQCHFEVSPETADDWIERWGKAVADRRYGAADGPRQLQRVKAEIQQHLAGANDFCRAVSERWIDLVRQSKSELAA